VRLTFVAGSRTRCEHGVRLDEPETVLQALHTAIVAGMRLALDLLPALVTSMRASGSTDRVTLTAAVRAATYVVGDPPASWEPMMREMGVWRVTFTAEDDFSNVDQCASTLTVVDTTPPDIECPAPITIECNEFGGVAAGSGEFRGTTDRGKRTPEANEWAHSTEAPPVLERRSLMRDVGDRRRPSRGEHAEERLLRFEHPLPGSVRGCPRPPVLCVPVPARREGVAL
jgi:hypothetical protein